LLVHSILGKRMFKPEYKKILSDIKVDKDYVIQKLTKIFNKRIAGELFSLSQKKKFNTILNKKNNLIKLFIIKNNFKIIPLFFRWLKWKKFFKPWPLISFIGPDGAGKSTTAAAVSSYLNQNGHPSEIVYTGRGRNQILPIRKIGNAYKSKERKKPKKKSLVKKVIYTLWAPVFTIDLLLRYLFVIFPRRMKKRL